MLEAQTSVPWLAAAYDATAGRLTLRVNGARVTGAGELGPVVIRDTAGMRDAGGAGSPRAREPGTTQPHKVLVVGVDGVGPTSCQRRRCPTRGCAASASGSRAPPRSAPRPRSPAGWASVLTGVEPTKHRITANANYAPRDRRGSTFLVPARNGLRLRTSVVAHWPDILQLVEPDALDERSMGDDLTAANAMA